MIDQRLLDEFIKHTHTLKSKNTANTYELALKLLFPNTVDLSSNYIVNKISEWKEKKNAPNTIKLRLRALAEFIKFASMFEFIENKQYLLDIIKGFKGEEKVTECLTKEEVIRLIKCATKDRDKVIISTLAMSGIRLSELINLDVSDVKHSKQLHIRNTKNNIHRLVNIPDNLYKLLQEFIQKYKLDNITAPLFQNKHGERVAPESVQQMLKRIGRLADVPGVHPHLLRHFYITKLHNDGIPIKTIQDQSGHKSATMVLHYAHTNNQLKEQAANTVNDILEE